jgi:hypothetical protein
MKLHLALAAFFLAATFASAGEPEIVEIRQHSDPTKSLAAQRDKPLEVSSSRASKFRIVPGLSNPAFVSLELVGAKDHFVRHQKLILRVHERPQTSPPFDADATFKLIRLEGDKVRFEAVNKRNAFITLNESGGVVLVNNKAVEQSTFVLKK